MDVSLIFVRLIGANYLSFNKESLCHSIYEHQQHYAFARQIFHQFSGQLHFVGWYYNGMYFLFILVEQWSKYTKRIHSHMCAFFLYHIKEYSFHWCSSSGNVMSWAITIHCFIHLTLVANTITITIHHTINFYGTYVPLVMHITGIDLNIQFQISLLYELQLLTVDFHISQ